MDMTNFSEVLQWIVGGGSVIIVNWFVSWALERATWWHNLQSWVRSLAILVVAGAAGGFAQFLIVNPEVWQAYQGYINAFLLAVMGWLGSQKAHFSDPIRK